MRNGQVGHTGVFGLPISDIRLPSSRSYSRTRTSDEAFLLGTHITPLATASTHIRPDPTRTRKLLLNRDELNKLIGAVERRGYTLVPTAMYWKRGRAKLEIGLAKGKKQHDKRADLKEKDWKRDQERLFKKG